MLGFILNIIGIMLIIYSIFIIKKDLKDNEYKVEKLSSIEKNTKKYYEHTEDIVSSFERLVDLKLDKINSENYLSQEKHQTNKENETRKLEKDKEKLDTRDLNLSEEKLKIIELLKLGLTSEEIAKKLKKGVREIDIVIKMYKKNFWRLYYYLIDLEIIVCYTTIVITHTFWCFGLCLKGS